MQRLLNALARGRPSRSLYHFTDTRNLPSIRQHGLLSSRELERRGIAIAARGGDFQSLTIDRWLDLDGHVHLSIMNQHPMEKIARDDGRIAEACYLHVDPAVLRAPGVLFCPIVSTTTDAKILPIAAIDEYVDFDVAFGWVNYKDAAVLERVRRMRKLEILVPVGIGVAQLRNV